MGAIYFVKMREVELQLRDALFPAVRCGHCDTKHMSLEWVLRTAFAARRYLVIFIFVTLEHIYRRRPGHSIVFNNGKTNAGRMPP